MQEMSKLSYRVTEDDVIRARNQVFLSTNFILVAWCSISYGLLRLNSIVAYFLLCTFRVLRNHVVWCLLIFCCWMFVAFEHMYCLWTSLSAFWWCHCFGQTFSWNPPSNSILMVPLLLLRILDARYWSHILCNATFYSVTLVLWNLSLFLCFGSYSSTAVEFLFLSFSQE
jgi:hypothetical protein